MANGEIDHVNTQFVRRAACAFLFVALIFAALPAKLVATAAEPLPALASDKDKASFVYGQQLGSAFMRFGRELDLAELEKSARAALGEKAPKLSDAESKSALADFMSYIQKKNAPITAGVNVPPLLPPGIRTNASIVYGRNLAGTIDTLAEDLNLDVFFYAYAASAKGQTLKVNLAELTPAAKAYLDGNNVKMLARLCAKNKKIGGAFLAENKAREGVKTSASGLQYKVLYAGTGPKPVLPGRVAAHFKAFFVNGMLFHDSHDKGAPAIFSLDGVIDGWMEALKMMPEGSVWELYVPSDLAYGDRGSPGIPPGTTIVYQLELIKSSVQLESKNPPKAESAPASGSANPTVPPQK